MSTTQKQTEMRELCWEMFPWITNLTNLNIWVCDEIWVCETFSHILLFSLHSKKGNCFLTEGWKFKIVSCVWTVGIFVATYMRINSVLQRTLFKFPFSLVLHMSVAFSSKSLDFKWIPVFLLSACDYLVILLMCLVRNSSQLMSTQMQLHTNNLPPWVKA